MKPCKYCGRANEENALSCQECGTNFIDTASQEPGDSEIGSQIGFFTDLGPDLKRWLIRLLGLFGLAVAFALFLSHFQRNANAPGIAPRIVVLAASYSNGEQLVTFRAEPPSADISYADVVSAFDDGKTQPPTVRAGVSGLFPVRKAWETNHTLHFVAFPKRAASIGGKPLAYTPGSWTVAYTPTERAHRVRAGIAFEQKGIPDYFRRLRISWEQKSPGLLWMKSYRDAIFVTTEPFTNPAPKPDNGPGR